MYGDLLFGRQQNLVKSALILRHVFARLDLDPALLIEAFVAQRDIIKGSTGEVVL